MPIKRIFLSVLLGVFIGMSVNFFMIKPHAYREHFQKNIINPTLVELNLYSDSASNLLLGTGLQESCLGKLSANIFQIDLNTAEDIKNNYLAYRPKLAKAVERLYDPNHSEDWNLKNNIPYEIAIARIVYLRAKQDLPDANDSAALARFWKDNFNTYLGKGSVKQYRHIYEDKYYVVGVKRCIVGAWLRNINTN